MKKFICIHGHFYQPPRENPWTGEVDEEVSAKPYHDWNERISKECYAANTDAPVLGPKGEVIARINNFSKISFDIGPTLLSWMRRKDPETYRAIIDGDRTSVAKRRRHGNAMAQIYNHIIMPLASKRDKVTQVYWGVKDFEFHYGRKPEGMWLSETAVDRETLKILADHGILFTILAPHQAHRVRRIGFGRHWETLRHEAVDARRPYRIFLEGGKHFHIFFYDAPIARSIAFEGVLSNGDTLVQRLLSAFGRRSGDPKQLVSTATDGESFGHHHKFGEMAVAYAVKKLEDGKLASVTNYAEFLNRVGSDWEVEVYENTSWSCPHGVERWRADCGCRLIFQEGWNQRWRATLREAFDFLQKVVDEVFETEMGPLLKDPWQARNEYISVMLDDSPEQRRRFLEKTAKKELTDEHHKKIWDLLEAEKFSLLMYTSCGWFFDEISGIEPVHMMKFAARAMELVQPYHTKPIEPDFLKILAQAKSNLPEMGTGAHVYQKFVRAVRKSKP